VSWLFWQQWCCDVGRERESPGFCLAWGWQKLATIGIHTRTPERRRARYCFESFTASLVRYSEKERKEDGDWRCRERRLRDLFPRATGQPGATGVLTALESFDQISFIYLGFSGLSVTLDREKTMCLQTVTAVPLDFSISSSPETNKEQGAWPFYNTDGILC